MLCISRRKHEGVTLRVRTKSETLDIHVVVIDNFNNSNKCRLGIEADERVEIIRDELISNWQGKK